MTHRFRKAGALAAALFFLAATASAQTIFVNDGTGTDNAACYTTPGIGQPCKTIQWAIDNAPVGGTVQVQPGTYDENVVVTKALTLYGARMDLDPTGRIAGGPLESIIQPTSGSFGISIQAANVIVNGFEVDGSAATGSMWSGIIQFAAVDDNTISFNLIHDIRFSNPLSGSGGSIKYSYGIYVKGGNSPSSPISGLLIENNYIVDLGVAGVYGGVGMYIKSLSGATAGDGATITHNTLEDMLDGPVPFYGTGIAVIQDDNIATVDSGALIENNTYGDGFGDLDVGLVVGIDNTVVNEAGASFGAEVRLLVGSSPTQAFGAPPAVIDENSLAPFVKSTDIALTSTSGLMGAIGYFRDLSDAVAESSTDAELYIWRADIPVNGPVVGTVELDGADVVVDLNGTEFRATKAALEALGLPFTIVGSDGDDTVGVDPDAIPVLPSGDPGIIFDGGAGFDTLELLELLGTGPDAYVHDTQSLVCASPECGTFAFNTGAIVEYRDTAPVIDYTVMLSKTFNLTAADETITIGPDPADGTRTLIDSATMESVSFVNPTETLIVNAGAGSDVFDFSGLGSSNAGTISTVELNGEAGEDTFNVASLPDGTFSNFGGGTFLVDGGAPTTCLGDLLDFQLVATQTVSMPSAPANGKATFGTVTGVDVDYVNIERFANLVADLGVLSIVLDDDTLFPGDDGTITIDVTNLGTDPAQCVVVDLSSFPGLINTDDDNSSPLPVHSVTAGTYDETTRLWSIPALPVGTTETLVLTFVVDTQLGGDFVLTATIGASNSDPDPTNNSASTTLTVPVPFKFPAKAHAISAVFKTLDSGLERMILGLFLGSPGINGAVWCRIPVPDGDVFTVVGMPTVYKTCSEGLPSIADVNGNPVYSPLHVNDLWLDETGASAGRIYMTTWGSAGLYYSDDDGETWVSAEPDLGDGYGGNAGWVNIYSITEDVTDGILYISVNNGLVFRSLNNGTSWQQVSSLPEGSADTAFTLRSSPVTSGTIYAGTFGKGVYVSTDYGLSWNPLADNATLLASQAAHIFDLEIRVDGGIEYLFAATSRGVWRKNLTAATGWIELDVDQDQVTPTGYGNPEVRSIEFGDVDQNGDEELYAVTWGFGILRHLTPFAPAPAAGDLAPFALRGSKITMFAIGPDGTLFATTEDGAFYEMDPEHPVEGSAVANESVVDLPTQFVLEQNYPNPFNPVTSVGFSLAESAKVTLSVYDVLGRQVKVLAAGVLEAGRHEVTLDATDLPSGTYLYRLEAPGVRITRQMVLLK